MLKNELAKNLNESNEFQNSMIPWLWLGALLYSAEPSLQVKVPLYFSNELHERALPNLVLEASISQSL